MLFLQNNVFECGLMDKIAAAFASHVEFLLATGNFLELDKVNRVDIGIVRIKFRRHDVIW